MLWANIIGCIVSFHNCWYLTKEALSADQVVIDPAPPRRFQQDPVPALPPMEASVPMTYKRSSASWVANVSTPTLKSVGGYGYEIKEELTMSSKVLSYQESRVLHYYMATYLYMVETWGRLGKPT